MITYKAWDYVSAYSIRIEKYTPYYVINIVTSVKTMDVPDNSATLYCPVIIVTAIHRCELFSIFVFAISMRTKEGEGLMLEGFFYFLDFFVT